MPRKGKLPSIPKLSQQDADRPAGSQDVTQTPADQPPDLSHIPPQLHPLAVRCDSLVFDEDNCVEHDEANLDAIMGSLEEFGQRVLVVFNSSTRVIEKGNGTVRAALMLSERDPRWANIAAVGFDDDAGKATAFAIADNRAAQLGKWNHNVLKRQLEKVRTGCNEKLDKMIGSLADKTKLYLKKQQDKQAAAADSAAPEKWEVIVACDGEDQQKEIFERLKAEGLDCRLITF